MLKVAVIIPVYLKNQILLKRLLGEFQKYPIGHLRQIQFIIVDDCSPDPITCLDEFNMNMILLKIKEDIPWNQPGARNLGVAHSITEKIVICDVDNFIPVDTMSFILNEKFEEMTVYKFKRRSFGDKKDIASNRSRTKAAMLRSTYLSVGGHDERLCGHYDGDGQQFIDAINMKGGKTKDVPYYMEDLRYNGKPGYHSLNRDRSFNVELRKKIRKTLSDKFLDFDWEYVGEYIYKKMYDASMISVIGERKENEEDNVDKRRKCGFYKNIDVNKNDDFAILPVPIELVYIEGDEGPCPVLMLYRENINNVSEFSPPTKDNPIIPESYILDRFIIPKDRMNECLVSHHKGDMNILLKMDIDMARRWMIRSEACWDIDNERMNSDTIRIKTYDNEHIPIHKMVNRDFNKNFVIWEALSPFYDKNIDSVCVLSSSLGTYCNHLARMGKKVTGMSSGGWDSLHYTKRISDVCNLEITYYDAKYYNTIFYTKYDAFLDMGVVLLGNINKESVQKSIQYQCKKMLVSNVNNKNGNKYRNYVMNNMNFDEYTRVPVERNNFVDIFRYIDDSNLGD